MKKFFTHIPYILIGVLLMGTWIPNSLYTLELYQKICITGIAILCYLVLILEEKPSKYQKAIEEESKDVIYQTIKLDNEKDVSLLRTLRTLINRKLSTSSTNKNMILASKELCGKNCKCKDIKNADQCTCGMYDAYVQYLCSKQEQK